MIPVQHKFSSVLALVGAIALIAAVDVHDTPSGKIAIIKPAGPPIGSIILIPGASTEQSISDTGTASAAGNFVMRIRQRLVDAGYAVAYLESPLHLRAPIDAMRAIGRPVVLLGTSNGTIVAVDNAVELGKDGPDALVLTSTITSPIKLFPHPVTGLETSHFHGPVLFIHNTNDQCKFSQLGGARSVADSVKDATFIEFTSDSDPSKDQCGPFSAHGYAGIEASVVNRITNWIAAHAAARVDS